MSAWNRESPELAAMAAERDRLSTVHEVLSDILNAAQDVAEQKGHRDCVAERAKSDHWAAVRKPVLAEYFAAADAYTESKWGSEEVAERRAKRDRTFASDPEMRELIVAARADLAERRENAKRPEQDRRRSR